jgi:YjbE family integral membrane protein
MTDFSTLTQVFGSFADPQYWVQILQIIWINILLSGDNALVIALACASLPPRQRLWGMVLGAGVAVAMRVALAGVVSSLMAFPYIKLIGGCALVWIAVMLLKPDGEDGEAAVSSHDSLLRAIRTIAVADIVMSLDNVIAVAAAANGDIVLLVFGLAISIPLIVAGASLTLAILNRFPVVIWAGAGVLGWIAGDVATSDPILDNVELIDELGREKVKLVSETVGAAGVLAGGWLLRRRHRMVKA